MANSKQVKRSISQLQRVKTWQLFAVLLLMLFVAATFLRLNNVGMSERRNAVINADKSGDVVVTKTRLLDLQQYVSQHMNTSTGKFSLQGQYERDSRAAMDAAAEDGGAHGNIYKKAQEVCAPQFSGYSLAYQQCTLSELEKYAPGESLQSQVTLPSPELYSHSFAAPRWSPDFAGFSVLICVVIGLVIIGRMLSLAALKIMLKMRARG